MKSVNAFCQTPSSHLAKLYQYSRQLNELSRCVQSWLPSPLNQHVMVANFSQQILVLHVDSAVWVNQLRFMSGHIQQQWQQSLSQYPEIKQVKIKVQAFSPACPSKAKTNLHLSADNQHLVQAVANSTEDEKLKAALERLVVHAKDLDD